MSGFESFIDNFNNSNEFKTKIETKIKSIYLKRNIKPTNLSNEKIVKDFIIPIFSDEGIELSKDEVLELENFYEKKELDLNDLSNVAGGVNPILTIGMSIMSLLPNLVQDNIDNKVSSNITISQPNNLNENSIQSIILPNTTNYDSKTDEISSNNTNTNIEASPVAFKDNINNNIEIKEEVKEEVKEETKQEAQEIKQETQETKQEIKQETQETKQETQTLKKLKMPKKGIDVSVYQGNINWKKVKESGVEFAIIRLGYGSSHVDRNFKKNIEGAKAAGLKVGVYLYSYAQNKEQAKAEANFVLKQLKGIDLDYPVCYDVEDNKYQGNISSSELTEIAKTFMQTIKDAGYKTSLYSFLSWLNNKFDLSKLNDFDIWVAQWSNKCSFKKDYNIWQYSETGIVPGITGSVDLNYCYIDY